MYTLSGWILSEKNLGVLPDTQTVSSAQHLGITRYVQITGFLGEDGVAVGDLSEPGGEKTRDPETRLQESEVRPPKTAP